MRRGHAAGSDFTSSIAPSRGGSISILSNGRRTRPDRSEQVQNLELRDEAVRRRVLRARARPAPGCPRCRPPARRARASGSVKLPRPQNKSAMRSPGCGSSSSQRARHQHAVDRVVDLREIGRPEMACARRTRAARSTSVALRRRRTDARVSGPAGCSQIGRRAGRRSCAAAQIASSVSGSEMPQHQRGRVVADRDLDLRQAVAHRQRSDQLAQRHRSAREMRRGSTGHSRMSAT